MGSLSHLELHSPFPGGAKQGVSIDLVSDDEAVFDRGEWIGLGKLFSDVPPYVADACRAVRQISALLMRKLPSPDMLVSEFLTVRLPQIIAEKSRFPRRPSAWFSDDIPNCEPDKVWSIRIPPLSFLRDLESAVSQAWLNGAQSIVDPDDKNLRLPLWTIAFYREILTLREAQQRWAESKNWLPGDECWILNHVAWNSHHVGTNSGQLDWTRLIDDEWLCGENIDGMMYDVETCLSEYPILAASTIIAYLSFQREITKFATRQEPPNRNLKRFLARYVAQIKAGKTTMYFPVHINNNHWIAFKIDFANRTFGYGDSMSRSSAPKTFPFIEHLETWLSAEFPGEKFTNTGDSLTHSFQFDYIHCGIYTLNTIQHALFGTAILAVEECERVRLEWFKKFIHRAGLLSSNDSIGVEMHENFESCANFDSDISSSPPATESNRREPLSLADILNPIASTSTTDSNPPPVPKQVLPDFQARAPTETIPTASTSQNADSAHVTPPISPHIHSLPAAHRPAAGTTLKSNPSKRKRTSEDSDASDDDRNYSDEERAKKINRSKEARPRAKRTTPQERLAALQNDPFIVKLPSGELKGDSHGVYCQCSPTRRRKLEDGKDYILKNWLSHQSNPPAPESKAKIATTAAPATTRKGVVGDQRLDASYFNSAPGATSYIKPVKPRTELEDEVECLGLHGDGYQQLAWQVGDSSIGGVSAIGWVRISRALFPYKEWSTSADDADSEVEDSPDAAEETPEKLVREACVVTSAVTLAMKGMAVTTNKFPERTRWTDYEKQRLHQSLLVAARWTVYASTGSVFAKACLGITTNLNHTCSACTAVGDLPGLKRAVRRAREQAQLSPEDFAKAIKKKLTHTPTILSEHAAANAKASLANPAVVKLLSSKAMYGPVGAFLSLFRQAQEGDLDDHKTFVAICASLSDRVKRNKDPTGRAIHGIRHDPTFIKFCALARSYGPRSGAQYDLLTSMTGGISQRHLRRKIAKSPNKMVSYELCFENLDAAVEFGKRMNWNGPWVCAGDGTKLRPVLTVSSEFSEKGTAHLVGSTLPLRDVLFKSSEEQSRLITKIDAEKAIATQVWVLAIQIPLPGMPLFSVAFVPNKGKMKATEYRDLHLALRSHCGKAGIKLLASCADGAKAEIPSREDIDRACESAWKEAAALASQFCQMQIPTLPLQTTDLHPRFQTANGPAGATTDDGDEEEEEENELDAGLPSGIPTARDNEALLEPDVVRFSSAKTSVTPLTAEGLPGSKLTVSEVLAHAAHHIVTEQYFSEEAEKSEQELAAIEAEWEANPETQKTVTGRMQIANLLNPIDTQPARLSIPTFLPSGGGPISRLVLAAQRDRHCAATNVNSEKARKPQTDVRYLGGKFSLNHAAHQLKEDIQQHEGLRDETQFQKQRYRRWILTGPAVEWNIGCRLHFHLGEIAVPNVKTRGITAITPLRIDSFVVMRSALRIYLGKVLGIYRYGSVSGKHESFTDAETVEGLSYLSLEVYEQLKPRCNIFQHVDTADDPHKLALFTHAPISELVYLLAGAGTRPFGDEGMCSLTSGDNGWERWQALSRGEALRALKLSEDHPEDEDDEEDYDEPEVETGGKKRKPKPPRGAVKKQKIQKKPSAKAKGKKTVDSAATKARKDAVKRIRAIERGARPKKAKK
ncbi:hypothetical protein C8R43DRAFT_1136631 [Mycena crocata]|nr:hypothetical protein C8R43DRAFT_1136631 [Mycena crocata]